MKAQFDSPPKCGFTQNISSRERVKHWFFVSFNIISHIFPKIFIEFPQFVQNIWRYSPLILTIFFNFWDFLTYPCDKETNEVSILQMMSTVFLISKFCWKNMKGLCVCERGEGVKKTTPKKKLLSKNPALLR